MKKYFLACVFVMFLTGSSLGGMSKTWIIENIQVARLDLGEGVANCYVVSSTNREAYVIDPGGNVTEVLGYLKKQHLKVLGYLVTHAHNDHIKGLPQLVHDMPAPVGIHTDDIPLYSKRMGNSGSFDLFLQDGKSYGTGLLSFAVIWTPGHSPGGVCFHFKRAGVLFTGDTLFKNGVGRTDLDGGDAGALKSSLRKILSLPPETVLFPGHGDETTIRDILNRR